MAQEEERSMTHPESSKELVPGPKQPPRLHGEGCICGDYIRHDCPVKHRKPSKQAQQEHAAAWHRLVVSIATILEVNPNGSLEEIGNEIAGAIQQLRATARVCREDAEMNAARAERAEQKLAVTSNRQAWLQFSEYARRAAPAPEPGAAISQCPFCNRPCDERGGIYHEPHCEGLQDAGLNKLQRYMLEHKTAQPPGASALAKRTSMVECAGGGSEPRLEITFASLDDMHAASDFIRSALTK
jgi:hypothetical protein